MFYNIYVWKELAKFIKKKKKKKYWEITCYIYSFFLSLNNDKLAIKIRLLTAMHTYPEATDRRIMDA